MEFTKMHGLGNDYIYVDCLQQSPRDPATLVKRFSDRHFGIGSDGLVLILPSEKADFRMRMFNPDGSEAEMCGNAIRCVGKYVFEKGLTCKRNLDVETLAGVKHLELHLEKQPKSQDRMVTSVTVDMGEPVLKPSEIPVISGKDILLNEPILAGDKILPVTCVSMGNPHAVCFVDDLEHYAVGLYGPLVEMDERFPNRINSEFAEVVDSNTLYVRVWERGTGETLACGTGACAASVAAVLNGYCDRNVRVKLPGGELTVRWDEEDGHVYMTGPAVKVFEGWIEA